MPGRASSSRNLARSGGISIGWLRYDTDRPHALAVSSSRSSACPARSQSAVWSPSVHRASTTGSGSGPIGPVAGQRLTRCPPMAKSRIGNGASRADAESRPNARAGTPSP
jgi:hypothetical protein